MREVILRFNDDLRQYSAEERTAFHKNHVVRVDDERQQLILFEKGEQ